MTVQLRTDLSMVSSALLTVKFIFHEESIKSFDKNILDFGSKNWCPQKRISIETDPVI
jgi:hypothetical protein